jgi:hypothetical protein
MNNLDPEVAERPDDLVVYGGTGRAARDWKSFDAMVRTLTTLKADETMLVQSGRPVGVFRTHEWAPRVLIAHSHLVGAWARPAVTATGELAGAPIVRPFGIPVEVDREDFIADASETAGRAFDPRADEDRALEAVRLAVRRCATAWTGKKPVVDVTILKVDE